jgi:ankyrin repeat protein
MNRIVIVLCIALGSNACFALDMSKPPQEPLTVESCVAALSQSLKFFLTNPGPYKDPELVEKNLAQITKVKCIIPDGISNKREVLIIKLFALILAAGDPGMSLVLRDAVELFSKSPLHLGALLSAAVIYDNYCVFSCLLNAGAGLHVQSQHGVTPMSLAVASKRSKMLSFLRLQGRSLCSPSDSTEYSPVVVAAFNGFEEILCDLLTYESLEPPMLILALVNAVVGKHRGCIERLTRHLLALGLEPGAVLADPLFAAARTGQDANVEYFVEQGALPNVFVGPKNFTPLWAAVDSGSVAVVSRLLKAGANPDLYSLPEHSFWKVLIDKGTEDMLSLVLESKPDLSAVVVMGEPILEYAKKHGSERVKTILAEYARSKTPCV